MKTQQIQQHQFTVIFNSHFHHKLQYKGQLLQCADETLTISTQRGPALGHFVQFRILDETQSEGEVLKGTAKIATQSPSEDEAGMITMQLKLVQVDMLLLERFEALYATRKDIKAFVKSLRIAILTHSLHIRSEIRASLEESGLQNFTFFSSNEDFKQHHREEPVDCLISEWEDRGVETGIQLVRELRRDTKNWKTVCLLTGSTIDKTRLAQTVEHAVDEYISKPFTSKSLQTAFWQGLKRRKFPSPYALSLRRIEKYLAEKKWGEAEKLMDAAESLNAEPATAIYYKGYLAMIQQKLDQAFSLFERGLGYKQNHLKCLFGKAFILKKERKVMEYYETLKKILDVYPAHFSSLNDALILSCRLNETDFALQCLYEVLRNERQASTFLPTLEAHALVLLEAAQKQKSHADFMDICNRTLPTLIHLGREHQGFSARLAAFIRRTGWTVPETTENA